jgi:hypothetical protein
MDIFKHLKDNKAALISEKKFKVKEADAIVYNPTATNLKGEAVKVENDVNLLDLDNIKVKVVINTTNILDSHGDVHIKGIWNKSLKEQKNLYLLQEHQMTFSKIITDDLTASVKNMSWHELGFDKLEGDTQALIFEANVSSKRNEFMFEQYAKGYVKEHSVGMRYINILLCINSDEKYYREEKDNWDKYIVEVSNKEDAIAQGYFWAVTEAKIIEGSAVVKGSNYATPTLSVKNIEAVDNTSKNEPSNDTQVKQTINYNYLLTNLKSK